MKARRRRHPASNLRLGSRVSSEAVPIHPGSARFTGAAKFDWASPTLGSTHRFILFLAQSDSAPDHELAMYEVKSLGFSEIGLGRR
jgi:hypothetical protein